MAKPQFFLFLLLFLFLTHQSLQQQQQQISAADLAALHDIRNSLRDLPHSDFFSTWDFAAPNPCSTFTGLLCSPDPSATATPLLRVTSLTLGTGLAGSPGLVGSLTPALSNLTALTQIVLYSGFVSGSIPPQLGTLKNLRVISLTNNRLSGPIPCSLSTLPNLHTLDLSGNQLGGPVPASLTRLPSLKVLILASNHLSGELPNVTTQLLHLDLKNNRFSGLLPSMPLSLRYLSLCKNEMWGPLNVLVRLSELVYLDLSMNSFSGSIPESLFRPTLSSLLLQRNNLSGGVPRTLADDATLYGEGSIVDLSHNILSGELSPVLAGVEILFLNSNRLIGIVPDEYVRSVSVGSMKTLYLQHNYLSGFPLEPGSPPLPDSASLCLSYNCMVPPIGTMTCPANAGGLFSRPAYQCQAIHRGNAD
ncbi:LRR receptor-like serine/threonine-protein kinase ERECTA [Telopea speciosissima]|uniref:LRR receptor-like serine/threonine-protein kinase ERECTA n=1 Tax=Telopea speciosissima TaxID=54955 RepID=UPI001CC501C7|nr:LRR receptor-like serine/threonine-protein kinase ERECTA [Telopea speciosissima]